ncbi:bifunctional 5,10-methylene-tetrahydrofolate dehydrogenase/5,10-methylene-tetrahydrofolate cyclohydrolase [Haloquadratum walsbyi]|jgi:methylenetetrahydrofolate dehydrogenase (NADP+)/methenyltetrahydrofolate cyclohydrolase|uniref:Bifunctional protein FolD n=1 Tax=Haloquadratum walsbyi (strain DSM 16790 / HBSQ001) TaxID=362976 RepID=FOLD_HALWD|nr:bifunctional 5,10-methylene-tetrahydrofolate dehydrogenase/5,10-methylene-tetrahydrofolate cyclohydrolase [Haloquadratum walsbyi]Q18GK1.1 RecName: Full=Bifunctional protein FolD; Includes: RecName: Full=Methylenetetrahydrofolate dehydrogenase; Includes: RecName: Full=Methenyltetrahydrofolate cyclohydrolase [Haloquadratum walsbyi DSM 16790]CAJ52897.1 methylenetetrahydrofolate dehydrogenase / methenyltetrahydrofolate cyclohydrolase [Haloquadratum walsbyi DSM 16790]
MRFKYVASKYSCVTQTQTQLIDGTEVAASIRSDLISSVTRIVNTGTTPQLATVLMNDDPASQTYVSMKHDDCEEVGIATRDITIDPEAPAAELFDTVDELNADSSVHGILVQMPLPDHVDEREVLRRIDPKKDVDGFHPENVGRLVAGQPRYKPCTPHGIQKLLIAADIETEGANAVVIGRSNIVGKPMANLLIQKADAGNATVTTCHSRTNNLASKTRDADIIIAAAGVPEMIDGDMISTGTVVIDVGINRVETENGSELVGDVEFESAAKKADAITPVPGGVGPMTRAMLLWNTVKATAIATDTSIELP